jgi:hypothetical protein
MTTGRAHLEVRVEPNARVRSLQRTADGTGLAQQTAPSAERKASKERVALVVAHSNGRKADDMKSEASGRRKLATAEAS